MIDVDDNDTTTWLSRIRQAVGDDAIGMILKTNMGYMYAYGDAASQVCLFQRL